MDNYISDSKFKMPNVSTFLEVPAGYSIINKQTDKHTDRQADGRMDRQVDVRTDGQINK